MANNELHEQSSQTDTQADLSISTSESLLSDTFDRERSSVSYSNPDSDKSNEVDDDDFDMLTEELSVNFNSPEFEKSSKLSKEYPDFHDFSDIIDSSRSKELDEISGLLPEISIESNQNADLLQLEKESSDQSLPLLELYDSAEISELNEQESKEFAVFDENHNSKESTKKLSTESKEFTAGNPEKISAAEAVGDMASASIESVDSYWLDRPQLTKEELYESAEKYLVNPEDLEVFKKNIEKLENRAERDGVDEVELETFYAQVGKVLEASDTGNEFYNKEQLREIAKSMMNHAASPGTVNQGGDPTCTTAALESMLYAKEPNVIGELVSEAALTGRYTTKSGETIEIPERNLLPTKAQLSMPVDRQRSLASHIAQPLMINIKWNDASSYKNQPGDKTGQLRYEEGHPKEHIGDSGNRIMDQSGDRPMPVTEEFDYIDPLSRFSKSELPTPSYFITEHRPAEAPLMFMDDLNRIYNELRGNEGSITTMNFQAGEGVLTPESREDFESILEAAAAQRDNGSNDRPSFPIILGVHANMEPFLSDLRAYSDKPEISEEERNRMMSSHKHHAVAIFDYDPESGLVTVENQWGEKVDRTGEEGKRPKIHIDELYKAFTGLSDEERQKVEESQLPEKAFTADELIAQQEKFVTELEEEEILRPEKLLDERLELYRYLNHFDRNEDAAEQRDKIAEEFRKLIEGKDFEDSLPIASKVISAMNGTGETALAGEFIDAIENKFIENIDNKPGPEYIENLKRLKNMRENQESSDENAEKNSTLDKKFLEQIFGENSKYNITDKNDIEFMGSALATISLDNKELASNYFESMLEQLNTFENENGADSPDNLKLKSELLFIAMRARLTSGSEILAKDIQDSYDRNKIGVSTAAEFNDESLSTARFSLSKYYTSSKQPDKLVPILEDELNYHEELVLENGISRGKDHPALQFPLENLGSRASTGGALDKATEYYQRALEISRAHDPDRSERIARELAHVFKRNGKQEEAQKLLDEFGNSLSRFKSY